MGKYSFQAGLRLLERQATHIYAIDGRMGEKSSAGMSQNTAGSEEQQPAPTGKPLDLKNRNKKPAEAPANQEQEKAEAAAGELVPGKDFDPETGEVFENGRPPVDQPTTTEQPKSNQHKVITMGPKAVNA